MPGYYCTIHLQVKFIEDLVDKRIVNCHEFIELTFAFPTDIINKAGTTLSHLGISIVGKESSESTSQGRTTLAGREPFSAEVVPREKGAGGKAAYRKRGAAPFVY